MRPLPQDRAEFLLNMQVKQLIAKFSKLMVQRPFCQAGMGNTLLHFNCIYPTADGGNHVIGGRVTNAHHDQQAFMSEAMINDLIPDATPSMIATRLLGGFGEDAS